MTPEKWNAYLDRQLQLGRNGQGTGSISETLNPGSGITARSNIDAPAFNAMSAAGLNARAPSGVRGGGPLSLSAIKAQAAADAGEDELRYTVPGSGAPAWAPGGGGGPRRTNLAGRVTARLQRKAQQERERGQRHQQESVSWRCSSLRSRVVARRGTASTPRSSSCDRRASASRWRSTPELPPPHRRNAASNSERCRAPSRRSRPNVNRWPPPNRRRPRRPTRTWGSNGRDRRTSPPRTRG